jgi:hypothetical protein
MSKRKLGILYLLMMSITLSCGGFTTSVTEFLGNPDPNDPGLDPKYFEDDSDWGFANSIPGPGGESLGGGNTTGAQSSDPAPCTGVEVFAEDVRENDALFPEVIVYANAEQISPPDGYEVSYPVFPDSQPLNNNWRIILLDGGGIQVTTSQPVACAGVIFISDYISPSSIYIDGERRWNDYLYPPTANNPSRAFYVRVAVEPAHPITIQVVGHAPGGDYKNAYVPVYAFGFELP